MFIFSPQLGSLFSMLMVLGVKVVLNPPLDCHSINFNVIEDEGFFLTIILIY